MPAYNVEPYLAEAAASALGQTYSDLELVIVDDGSTDGTGRIA
jgi:glycosyltransferase involved in cell wall biosynthesis